jgi:hypothetical protein
MVFGGEGVAQPQLQADLGGHLVTGVERRRDFERIAEHHDGDHAIASLC